MIVTAAVCPGPPFLVPGLAPELAHLVPDLVGACRAAVGALGGTERIVTLTTGIAGAGPVARGPGSLVIGSSLARSDLPVAGPAAVLPRGAVSGRAERWAAGWGQADPDAAAVGTIVAAHLLLQAAMTSPTTAVEIDPAASDPARQVRDLVPDLDEAIPTGLLVIADGAAAHGGDAPGAENPMSAEFDRSLLAALGAGDPVALGAWCRERAEQAAALRCEALPAFAALADLTVSDPPIAGHIDYYGTPFGVGYIVAGWRWPWTA